MKYVLGALLLILVLLQVRLWSGAGSLQDINRLEHEIVVQELDNAVLQERNGILRQEVTDLKTGQDAIEERARSELGLIKKGETFYLIVEDQKAVSQPLDSNRTNELLVEPLPVAPEIVTDTTQKTAPEFESEVVPVQSFPESVPANSH